MLNLKKITAIAAVLVAVAPGIAAASPVNQSNWGGCLGLTTCNIGTATLTAGRDGGASGTATFGQQDFRGAKGLGVRSDGEGSASNRFELQGARASNNFPGETITIDYASPTAILGVNLLFLYNPNTFGGDPQEIAYIDGFLGGSAVGNFKLSTIDNVPTFSFSGAGSVTRTAPFSGNDDLGRFEISGLFGGATIDQLVFRAASVPSGDTHDYAIESVNPVPLPAAAWLLLAGIGGMGLVARRRKAAA